MFSLVFIHGESNFLHKFIFKLNATISLRGIKMNVTAINSIYLNEDTGGKGRFFKSRFLQAGLVKYQFELTFNFLFSF